MEVSYTDGGYVMNGDDEASGYYTYGISVTKQEPISTNDTSVLKITYDRKVLLDTTEYNLHFSGAIARRHRDLIRGILENELGVLFFSAVNRTIALIYEVYCLCSESAIEEIEADVCIIETYHGMDRELALSAEDSLRPTPASREAVEALEKVLIDIRETSCVVCLEELSLGSEATKMPCSHVFHHECIVKWLENRFVCPLCRFELPPEPEVTRLEDMES